MPLHILDNSIWFPPVTDALEDGLLAIGGNLSPERLLLAYQNGIFPWYDGDVPLWWSPDPRFVLFPSQLKVSKSMKVLFRKNIFEYRLNTAFSTVVHQCRTIKRPNESGTWINEEVETAYSLLHKSGLAISAECWQNNQLVGGLYGVLLGKVFFGESMFSQVSNASKFAFISLIQDPAFSYIKMIDCQIYSEHLESLGAVFIPRNRFVEMLDD